MATDKRERQRAAREARQADETTADKRTRRTRTGIRVAAIVGAALVAAFAYSMIFGGSDDDGAEAEDEVLGPAVIEDVTVTETADGAATEEAPEADQPGEAFADREPEEGCPPEDGSAERETEFDGPPPWCIDVSASYVAEVATSEGTFEIALDPMQAPLAVNNFVFLSRWDYYDGSTFHRAVPDFAVQGGDPVGDPPGGGNPGYTLGDDPDFTGETPTEEPYYPLMSVAMANSGDPGTAGSQFFVVVGENGEALPPDYTRFGQVTDGEDAVRAIEGTSEHPDVTNS